MTRRLAAAATAALALALASVFITLAPPAVDAAARQSTEPAHARTQTRAAHLPDSVLGVFEGRTPCSALAAEFTGFPLPNCEKIKWELALHHDPRSGRPTTFEYRGTRATRRGTWSIVQGAPSDRRAVIYRLRYDPGKTLALLRVDANILLILDHDLTPLVGDASWSYTLSRTDKPRR